MLNYDTIEALSHAEIRNSILTLDGSINKNEFEELREKLRAALLTHKIPIYKPVAAIFDGIPTLPRVTSVNNKVSKGYLGMLPEFSYCICMPPENMKTIPGVWERKKVKDDIAMPRDKMTWAKSLGVNELIYIRSVDDGDITLDKCVYNQDPDVSEGVRTYVKPLLLDCPPIVSIAGEGAFVNLHMAIAVSCNKSSCADVIKTIGNIEKNYVQVAQIYGLEEYILVSPMDVGFGKIKFTYKRDIDETVFTEIIQRFAKRLLSHFQMSIEQPGTPAYVFCRKSVRDISHMWEDI